METNWRWKTGKDSRCSESGGETEARKTDIAMGDCIKRDLERVGGEWKHMIVRRNWRLLAENVVREKWEEEKRQWKWNHGQLTPDDSDAKKIITTKCNLALVNNDLFIALSTPK